MGDRLDNLLSVFGKNRKSVVYVIAAYVIILVIVLVVIWWPRPKTYSTYTPVDLENKKEQVAQNYLNILNTLFRNKNTDKIEELISYGYIRYTGKSVSEIIGELQNSNFFSNTVEVKGISVYSDENTYVYSTRIYSGNNSRIINIIETSPYNFELVFDDFYSYEEYLGTVESEDINFTINSMYRNLKYVEIDVGIENLNLSYARFNFGDPTAVQAILADGTKYSVANAVSYETYTNVQPNTTINKKFVFEIPAQLQNSIEYIIFNGVTVDYSQKNIKVNI